MLTGLAEKKGAELYSMQTGDFADMPGSVRYTIRDSVRRGIQLQQYGLKTPPLPKDHDIHPGNIFEVCIDPKNPVNIDVEQLL